MQVLVRSDSHKQENRMGIAIADLCLQTDIGESLAKLLELRNGLGLVYSSISN
jgi:hypothetical protein